MGSLQRSPGYLSIHQPSLGSPDPQIIFSECSCWHCMIMFLRMFGTEDWTDLACDLTDGLFFFCRSLEKRLHTQWGKRAEGSSDELYQRILRELYHSARLTQSANPHYSADHDSKFLLILTCWRSSIYLSLVYPLTLEQLLAQRRIWNEENAGAPENMS